MGQVEKKEKVSKATEEARSCVSVSTMYRKWRVMISFCLCVCVWCYIATSVSNPNLVCCLVWLGMCILCLVQFCQALCILIKPTSLGLGISTNEKKNGYIVIHLGELYREDELPFDINLMLFQRT